MNPTRFKLLRRQIAELLNAGKPLLTPEYQLLNDLRVMLNQPPTQAEFDHVIGRMESARQIIRHRTEDEGVKTKLTETGEAELLT